MVYVIRCIVRETGMRMTPDDLSKFPDFPRKSTDMSLKEYGILMKKYWNTRKNAIRKQKKKTDRDEKIEKILVTLIPEDLTDYPDFPEFRGKYFFLKLKLFRHGDTMVTFD